MRKIENGAASIRRKFWKSVVSGFVCGSSWLALSWSSDVCFGQTAWINPAGGAWYTGTNWAGGSVPGPGGIAQFSILNGSYTVSWNGVDSVTSGLIVANGNDVFFVNQTNAPRTYTVAGNTIVSGTNTLLAVGSGNGNVMRLVSAGMTINSGATAYSENGSSIISTGTITAGSVGNGNLTAISGGLVQANTIVLGDGGYGAGLVYGAGSQMTAADRIAVARSGTGYLNLDLGGVVTCDRLDVGENVGSSGQVDVGFLSSLTSDLIFVGNDGNGQFNVINGGQVTGTALLAFEIGSQANVTISGPGSRWDASLGNFTAGVLGDSTVLISNGGEIVTASFSIGVATNVGSRTVTVTGNGSRLTSAALNINTGTLQVLAGGQVTSTSGTIGNGPNGSGVAIVAGPGSIWEVTNLFVANDLGSFTSGSQGTLTIHSGGTVQSAFADIGRVDSGNPTLGVGTVTITGAGSTWNNSTDILLGFGGTGIVNLENQGRLNVGGNIAIDNGGQIRLNGGRLEFGNMDVASFTRVLKNSGSAAGNINISGTNNLAAMNGLISDGANLNQVHLVNGGMLQGSNQVDVSLVNSTTGELRASTGDWIRFRGNENTNNGLIQLNGGLVQFNRFTNLADGIVQGQGFLATDTQLTNAGQMAFGFGTSELIGDVVNQGAGVISNSGAGTLFFRGNLWHDGAEISTAGGSQTFVTGMASGSGDYFGEGTITFAGGFRPGEVAEQVRFYGHLAFDTDNTTFLELGGTQAGAFDQLLIDGNLSLGDSRLNVSLLSHFTLTAGMEFLIADIVGTRTGFFEGLGEGALVGIFGDQGLFITYQAGDGNGIALFTQAAIPEPSVMLPLGLLAGWLTLRRHRRD